jgi:hypothetical protein
MKSKQLASMIGGSVVAVIAIFWSSPTTAAVPTVTVFKSQACECCSAWVEHLEDSGFTVAVTETEALQAIKAEHGVGSHLASCHTALIDGYVVEGHAPADDIKSMLRDAPDIVGLAVPGMIIGTPGMEVPGQLARPYQVLAFDEQGETIVYSSR